MYLFVFFLCVSLLNAKTPNTDSEAQEKPINNDKEEQKSFWSDKKVEYVTELTSEDFFEKVATGYWLVQFYVPWCGFCKRLASTWEDLGSLDNHFNVGKIDCSEAEMLSHTFGIRGFPTIKLFKDGKMYDFPQNMDRSVDKFLNFATSTYESMPAKDIPARPGILGTIGIVFNEAYVVASESIAQYPYGSVALISFAILIGFTFTSKFIIPNEIVVIKKKQQ